MVRPSKNIQSASVPTRHRRSPREPGPALMLMLAMNCPMGLFSTMVEKMSAPPRHGLPEEQNNRFRTHGLLPNIVCVALLLTNNSLAHQRRDLQQQQQQSAVVQHSPLFLIHMAVLQKTQLLLHPNNLKLWSLVILSH